MITVEDATKKVQKAKDAVARAKTKFKEANEFQKETRRKVLKSAKTKLSNAKDKLSYLKTEENGDSKAKKAKDWTCKKISKVPVKKALSWTGLSIVTVGTAIGAFALYEALKNEDSKAAVDNV